MRVPTTMFEYEVHEEMISSESRSKLTKDLVIGHELSKELVPRSRPRNVVAQLLGLAPLPIEPKPPQRQAKEVVSSTGQVTQQDSSSQNYQLQRQADAEDAKSIDSLSNHSEGMRLDQLKKEMDKLQHSRSWSTLRSLLLEADGQVLVKNMQAIKEIYTEKAHHNSIYVSPSHIVSLKGYQNSKEIIEAMDFLQSNEDFFSKVLNDPNSLFTRRLLKGNLNPEPCSSPREAPKSKITHVGELRDEEAAQHDVVKPKKSVRSVQHTKGKADGNFPSGKQNLKEEKAYRDGHLICDKQKKSLNDQAKSSAFHYPTKIVLLKPRSAKMQNQRPPSVGFPSDQAARREAIYKDNSDDVFDMLTKRLMKLPRAAKVEETSHLRQKTQVNHRDDCKASRGSGQRIAKQVRDALRRESMQRNANDGIARRENILNRSATDQVESFTPEMSASIKLFHWDPYASSRTETLPHSHPFGKAKKLHVKECQNTILDRSRVLTSTKCHWEHLTVPVADVSKHCNQRSQSRIPQFMVIQNIDNSKGLSKTANGEKKTSSNGSMKGLKQCKPDFTGDFESASQVKKVGIHSKQVHYAERLGKFLLESNKTKVDVAVESLLSRNRRLSSTNSKGRLARQSCDPTDQAAPCLDQCDAKFRHKFHAVASAKTTDIDAVTNPQQKLSGSSTLFEKADNLLSSAAYNQSLSTSCNEIQKDRCKSITCQTAVVEFVGIADGEIQFKSDHNDSMRACSVLSDDLEYQNQGSLWKSTTTVTGKAVSNQCEMLSTAFFKDSRAIDESASSVDFKEAGAKLQELRLRLQLLKAQEKRVAEKKMGRAKLDRATKEPAVLDSVSVRAAAGPESAYEHSEAAISQIDNSSIAENKNSLRAAAKSDHVADRTLVNCDNDSPGAANALTTADSEHVETKLLVQFDDNTLRVANSLNPAESDFVGDSAAVHNNSDSLTAQNSWTPAPSDPVLNKIEHSDGEGTKSAKVEGYLTIEVEKLYVQKILDSSPIGQSRSCTVISKWHAQTQPLDPQLFYTLEDSLSDVTVEGGMDTVKDELDGCSRKLLFDFVNEILLRMLCNSVKSCCWTRPFKIPSTSIPTSKELLNWAWTEKCKLSSSEADTTEQLVAKDIAKAQLGCEIAAQIEAVGEDLETAILNDLIAEFVMGQSRPKLFGSCS